MQHYKALIISTDHLKPSFKAAFQNAVFHVGLMCLSLVDLEGSCKLQLMAILHIPGI